MRCIKFVLGLVIIVIASLFYVSAFTEQSMGQNEYIHYQLAVANEKINNKIAKSEDKKASEIIAQKVIQYAILDSLIYTIIIIAVSIPKPKRIN